MPSRSVATTLFLALALTLGAAPAVAEVFLSREEAIAVAFPHAERVESHTFVLDDAQAAAVEHEAGARLESRLVTVYTGWSGGQVVGYALIDVHTVRTLPEALLVVLDPDGQVSNLRMIAFYEPPEYRAPERWLAQFEHSGNGGEVHGIAGATLSTRAVKGSIRRALAIHHLLLTPRAPAPAPLAKDGPSAPLVAGTGGGQ